MRHRFAACVLVVSQASLIVSLPIAMAAAPSSFRDVPSSSSLFAAVEYLKAQNIFGGYPDGTFRPDAKVNRAEALKILMSTKSGIDVSPSPASSFSDVASDAWYEPFVERAKTLGIISGPPAKTVFRPADPVVRAEFLKMFFKVTGIDTSSAFSDLTDPLATDAHPADWFFPHMRYALASSMVMIDANGHLNPGDALTRGDVASLLYRYLMFDQGRRTQALLSEAESEVVNLLQMIDQKQLEQAEYASARSLVSARGALQKNSSSATVKGAVKITEGFRLITQAFRAGTENRLDDVIANAKDAYATAEKAKAFSPSLDSLASQMESIAKSMADSARALKK